MKRTLALIALLTWIAPVAFQSSANAAYAHWTNVSNCGCPTQDPGQGCPTQDPGQGCGCPTQDPGQGCPSQGPGQNPGQNPGQDPGQNPGQNPGQDPGQGCGCATMFPSQPVQAFRR